MERPLLVHSQFTENTWVKLNVDAQCAFATSCCQRLLPILTRAQKMEDVPIAEALLEESWAWLAGLSDPPKGDGGHFEESIRPGEGENDADLCREVALQFARLNLLLNGDSREGAVVGYWNTALLDSYLYGKLDFRVCSEHDQIVDSEPLMEQEFARQRRDLFLLLRRNEFHVTVRNMWKRSML